jgi:nicotinamidase-related amidase
MYTLVVVDMQSSFEAANSKRVRENVKREIQRAMDNKAAIVFVEYVGQGPTIPSLVKPTDDYDRVFIVRKNDDDGSKEVSKVIRDNNLPGKRVKVCGVNTDCCVLETVNGLCSRLRSASFEVVGDACNSDFNHLTGLNDMANMSNVSIRRG